jgi:lysozyme
MKTAKPGIDLICSFEAPHGPDLKPYLCPAGKTTIAFGNTYYPNGRKVTMKDPPITVAQANEIFQFFIGRFEREVISLLKKPVNQNQFDALVCFAYNCGSDIDQDDIPEGLGDSTLLKLVNQNPNDPAIRAEFLKWNKGGGKVLNGLIARRTAEAELYFTPVGQPVRPPRPPVG